MWTRKELKGNAKAVLKANYWKAVLVSFILALLLGSGAGSARSAASGSDTQLSDVFAGYSAEVIGAMFIALVSILAVTFLIHVVLKIFVWNPLQVGCYKFFLNCSGSDAKIRDVVFAFKNGYGKACLTMLVRYVCTFLWSLLLIIPGIVKSYEYMMIPYILADNPGISRKEAFAKSKEMMRGQKWKAFVLDLSFLGWMILGFITLGIVDIFYVTPYMNLTRTQLYYTLKNN